MQRTRFVSFALALVILASCQRAQQYSSPAKSPRVELEKTKVAELSPRLSWIAPLERADLPIQFVSEASPEWQQLPAYWTHYPPIRPYLAQPPLAALAALVVANEHAAIKVKVPRGLPDPTPHFPSSNPPTYGKWRLGKELFNTRLLRAGASEFSCASCHLPQSGFTEDHGRTAGGKYNTLSLVNVAYNRRQFWDGRVQTLEETLVRSLEDEGNQTDTESRTKALHQHIWGGFVRSLVDQKDEQLNARFDLVFGVPQPTQDTVAQALATYLRTLLSGDSLFDRADKLRRDQKATALSAEHFRALVADETTANVLLDGLKGKPGRDALPALAAKGHDLFHGRARCVLCHHGPLFTDQDYHNVGYLKREDDAVDEGQPQGKETGRAVHTPIGLKESRLVGAFRTPTLRNLARTAPYFHDGSQRTLSYVVQFYDDGVQPTPHLAKALKDGEREQRLRLSQEEMDALVIFLRTLEGRPIEAILR